MSATADINYDGVGDPEFVAERLGEVTEQREEQVESQDEALSLQHRIERQLEDESVDVPIGEETMAFDVLDRETSQFVAAVDARIKALGEGDDPEAEFDEAVDRMYAIAADYSQPSFADMDWWERHFSIPRMIAILTYVNAEGKPLSEGEAKK